MAEGPAPAGEQQGDAHIAEIGVYDEPLNESRLAEEIVLAMLVRAKDAIAHTQDLQAHIPTPLGLCRRQHSLAGHL
jgi:hypothetical protein